MRRKDRELGLEDAIAVLTQGEYGILATFGEEYPYAVPVNYVCDGDKIYYHGTSEHSQKKENIARNSKVCFTVVGKTELLPAKFATNYESVVVFGTAAEVLEKKRELLHLFIDKYSKEFQESGMKYIDAAADKVSLYEIEIEKITGKARR